MMKKLKKEVKEEEQKETKRNISNKANALLSLLLPLSFTFSQCVCVLTLSSGDVYVCLIRLDTFLVYHHHRTAITDDPAKVEEDSRLGS